MAYIALEAVHYGIYWLIDILHRKQCNMAYIALSVPLIRPRNMLQIYIYVCVTLRNTISGAPWGQHVFKMASPPATRILTLHFWRMKDQRFGQVDHFVLPRLAYYSSNTIRDCVASVWAEIWPLETARRYHGRSSDMNVIFKQQSLVSLYQP